MAHVRVAVMTGRGEAPHGTLNSRQRTQRSSEVARALERANIDGKETGVCRSAIVTPRASPRRWVAGEWFADC
jgi:hypothetical protein